MFSEFDPLWDSDERAGFRLTSTIDVNIWVTSCKVTKCYMQFGGVARHAPAAKAASYCVTYGTTKVVP
jgi:hypothetical protein